MFRRRTLRPVPNGPAVATVDRQTLPETPARPVAPLRLVGSVVLPDARDALVSGDQIAEVWARSLELVDQGQEAILGVVAVSNSGRGAA